MRKLVVKLLFYIKKEIRRDEQCHCCCLWCKYYSICKEDL